MRRNDREITDGERIDGIIGSCVCCRLGFSLDGGGAYVVPMSFGFVHNDGVRSFYFHSAKQGRKLELIRSGDPVGFELDTGYRLNEAPAACGYSAAFQSVIGVGRIAFVTEADAKRAALDVIMRHNTGKGGWHYTDAALDAVCVFRLDVTELACKEHL